MEKIKCKVCGTEVDAKVIGENHYIVTDTKSIVLTGISKHYYDAFDCPVCKCQNILGERYRKHIAIVSENTPDEIVFVEKENKTLCDKCNKQDKECSCDCTREFEEKDKKEKRNNSEENEKPDCFGNFASYLDCMVCDFGEDCYKKALKEKENNEEKQPECYGDFVVESKGCSVCKMRTKCKNEGLPKCFGEYEDKNIACVEKCDVIQQCKYYTTGKTDGK